MSHRSQTREEHFAKTHRRVYNRDEMAKRFKETQARKARDAMNTASAVGLMSNLSRLFRRRPVDGKPPEFKPKGD